MSNKNNSGSGIGYLSALELIFITLKLTGYIDWSWWWVFAPTWIPLGIAGLIFIIALIAHL
jgi:hypothetical protein